MDDEWGADAKVPIERFTQILGDLADELPDEIYRGLNLGVIVSEEARLHWESRPESPLYTLGVYVHNNMGRQIIIYYGSMMLIYGHLPEDRLKDQMRDVLHHELLHHLENLGGEFGLEFEDHLSIQGYRDSLRQDKRSKR